MSDEHTSGPWERRGTMVYGIDTGPGSAPFIADCERAVDARLIAAAPDLLEAAEAAVERLTYGDGNAAHVSNLLRAAVRRARGEEPNP